ncbi:MAG: peptidoglycan D,D-transpeptidase FtsI family protein [Propioniciclava sp.]
MSRSPGRRSRRVPLASSAFRLRMLLLIVAMAFSVVGARAVQIQVLSADAMAAQAAEKMTVARTLPAQRGQIVDRQGAVLAYTESTVNVVADPAMIASNGKEPEAMRESDRAQAAAAPEAMAVIIARHTGGDPELLQTKLERADTRYQLLAKQIPSTRYLELIKDLNEAGYVGIFREMNPKRVYPMGAVASNVVGFMSEGKGLGGLEYLRQDQLAGVPGREVYETSPNGKIPLGTQVLTPATDGQDIQLTLDADLQWMTERLLAERVEAASGLWGVAVVMDVESGELLSLANYPSYDSNDPGAGNPKDMGNRAVSSAYEPGSVQKILTLSALVDAGLTTPDTTYAIGPTVKVGEHMVSDAFGHGEIDITTRGILVKSSNVGAITAAREMEPERLRGYLESYGLGKPTGMKLPGEASGALPAADMPSYTADSMAFGYGLSVTSVQMAAAVAAIANDGVYTAPSIIKAEADDQGMLTPADAPASHRVISAEAARAVLGMMEQRTIYNMNKIGVEGYRTGSKTGTARLSSADGGYSGQVASMIGVGPIEDPQVLVYVLVGRPDQSGAGLGMAGPLYRDLMSIALPRYGVQPSASVPDEQQTLIVEPE